MDKTIEISIDDVKTIIGIIKVCESRKAFYIEEELQVENILNTLVNKLQNEFHIPFDKIISNLEELPKIEDLPDYRYDTDDIEEIEFPRIIVPEPITFTYMKPLSPIIEVDEPIDVKVKKTNYSVLTRVLE